VKADGGAPDVAFLHDRHEVTQQPEIHDQPRYRRGIGRAEEVLARADPPALDWSRVPTIGNEELE
jgi:hypothetical protein